jgi:hypothetical protein
MLPMQPDLLRRSSSPVALRRFEHTETVADSPAHRRSSSPVSRRRFEQTEAVEDSLAPAAADRDAPSANRAAPNEHEGLQPDTGSDEGVLGVEGRVSAAAWRTSPAVASDSQKMKAMMMALLDFPLDSQLVEFGYAQPADGLRRSSGAAAGIGNGRKAGYCAAHYPALHGSES